MGRPGLSNHPKFLRLARALGSEALARGSLELMWEVSYESGDPRLGDADGVEAAARWRGEAGVLFAALRDAGGPGRLGFVEPDETGEVWLVHDLFDHAPDYVRKRARREDQRRASGRTLAAERRSVTGQRPENGSPPAPTPAPAPNYIPPAGAAGTGQAESDGGGSEHVSWADELPLGVEVRAGAQVAAKAVKPRGKKPNASQEPTSSATGSFRRQLTDALDAAFLRATGTKYPWENRRNYSAGALGTGQKPGVVMELAKRHGIPEVAGRFELGVREAHREHAPGRRRVANLWELPDAWAHLTDAVPVEPAAPRGPAWMTGEVGERWRRAAEDSGRAHVFEEVAGLVVRAELDIDVLRLTVQDENARAWIGQRTPDPWSNKPATSLLGMLQEWLGEVTVEVQPGGGE